MRQELPKTYEPDVYKRQVEDLRRRTVMRRLLKSGVFRRAVVIHGRGAERQCRVEELL